ncbi:Beta-1,4-mannosyl-glycoprotein 4-beta-N-acetylglucosaminyltransferase [Nymphon striatum]|nr:Beta-1,4-mannosyl-glycoprotein 4-beta-N-acetylglucosaminyltransferase [Nymphon striatum]
MGIGPDLKALEEMNDFVESNRLLKTQKQSHNFHRSFIPPWRLPPVLSIFLFLVSFVVFLIIVFQTKLHDEDNANQLHLSNGNVHIPYTEDDILYPRPFHLTDSRHISEFFTVYHHDKIKEPVRCFTKGVQKATVKLGCVCKQNWHGKNCAIPDSVWYSDWFKESKFKVNLKLAKRLRRVICASWFAEDSSLDLLKLKLMETADVIDVFFIVESNFTSSCEPRKPTLLNRLRNDSLKQHDFSCFDAVIKDKAGQITSEKNCTSISLASVLIYHSKIVYSLMHTCPSFGVRSWPEFHQMIAGAGVFHLVTDYRPSDIIIFSNPDEIMSKDYITFLKLYENIPEPYAVTVHTSIFGFGMPIKFPTEPESKVIGSSVKYLVSVCTDHAIDLQFNGCDTKNAKNIQRYQKIDSNNFVKRWTTSRNHTAWWKCKWCLPTSLLQHFIKRIFEETGIELTIQKIYSEIDDHISWVKKGRLKNSNKIIIQNLDKTSNASLQLPESLNMTSELLYLVTGNFSEIDLKSLDLKKSIL